MLQKSKNIFLMFVIVTLFGSCTTNVDSNLIFTGRFLGPRISGLNYTCLPSGHHGKLNNMSEYSFELGDKCNFSIGKLSIGSSKAAAIMTLHGLYNTGNHSHVVVARANSLLITLDSDQNASNGISIDEEVQTAFSVEQKIADISDQMLTKMVEKVYPNRELNDIEEAIEHLAKSLDFIKHEKYEPSPIDDSDIAGKRFEFINSNEDEHEVFFNTNGTYEDGLHECETSWKIVDNVILINKDNCPEEEASDISIKIFGSPEVGSLAVLNENDLSHVAIISRVTIGGFETQSLHSDRDYKHITFVNQTNSGVCVKAFLHWHTDHRIYVAAHSAKYLNLGRDHVKKKDKFGINYNTTKHSCSRSESQKEFKYFYDHDDFNTRDVLYIHGVNKINKNVHVSDEFGKCDSNANKPAILFAHGYMGFPAEWDDFTTFASSKKFGWRVFRTSVSRNGSIKKRAHMLNTYIKAIIDRCGISDGQLRVVTHSMGGLDIRYILSSRSSTFKEAQAAIERVYTISTPHRGSGIASAGSIFMDDGTKNLTIGHMNKFNEAFPYTRMQSKDISMLSLRFHCDKDLLNTPNSEVNKHAADGVVKVKRQILSGAPYSKTIFSGSHAKTTPLTYGHCEDSSLEKTQLRIIKMILEDHDNSPETNDIPHYGKY